MNYEVTIGGTTFAVELPPSGEAGPIRVDGRELDVDARFVAPSVLHLLVDGKAYELDVQRTGAGQEVSLYGTRYEATVLDERKKALLALGGGAGGAGGDDVVSTSMPGKVVALLVAEGDVVSEGQGIVVVEAMKMENELKARGPGVVKQIKVAVGDAVEGGSPLVILGGES